ncbi:MAG: hypothetical protein AVDCRST_MAG54-3530 [uncultured Actinomycetospora sp.]|uniref:DUF3040 domain-containing protein n=1 Tax=uncultured Actinomycetospora sp. TaxID=1135996 RepID=A0A6J4JJE2_9PSEU|nr:MAG: hypothetical protein AVDCRST_MAG54-3530 [uncultured Actinomycetospora sp.]
MMRPHGEDAPLSAAEQRALREITQNLVRTDPDLFGTARSGHPGPHAGGRLVAVAVTAACLSLGVVTLAAGALVALGAGAGLVAVVTSVATIGHRRASARRPPDTG